MRRKFVRKIKQEFKIPQSFVSQKKIQFSSSFFPRPERESEGNENLNEKARKKIKFLTRINCFLLFFKLLAKQGLVAGYVLINSSTLNRMIPYRG